MIVNDKEFLFVEKYRPNKLDDVILPESLKENFQAFLDKGELQNMILVGSPGVGKTTVAKALCNQLNLDYMLINASEDSGIDVLRTKIRDYASTVSFNVEGVRKHKVVILDEADYLNINSTQPALRSFMEDFSKNCRFILTANFKNKIMEALTSRCHVIDFKFNKKTEMPKLMAEFYKRASAILDNENIKYDKKVLLEVVGKTAPDWRKVLNALQYNSKSGTLSVATAQMSEQSEMDDLMNILKGRRYQDMRKWVAQSINNDPTDLIRRIYEGSDKTVKKDNIPQLILILADYQYKNAFVADHEINIVAMLTEIMQLEFN